MHKLHQQYHSGKDFHNITEDNKIALDWEKLLGKAFEEKEKVF